MENVTAVIKSFKRWPYLQECVRSMKELYHDIRVIVADDSLQDGEEYPERFAAWISDFETAGGRFVRMPFDSGLCVGRNRLVDMVETRYALIGDDDFQYRTEPIRDMAQAMEWLDPRVSEMRRFLERHEDFDLIGGRVFERSKVRNYQGYMIREPGMKLRKVPLDIGQKFQRDGGSGLRFAACDLTFNYFMARTECLKVVRWNEEIKVAYEHTDFFLRFKEAGGRVAFSPDPIVVHKPDIGEVDVGDYRQFRMRKSDKRAFYIRHKLAEVTDFSGRTDHL